MKVTFDGKGPKVVVEELANVKMQTWADLALVRFRGMGLLERSMMVLS